ncbi:hypothetical protein B0H67DRAFT_239210 [Lasiosphaeris hirsuta]|uniref:Microbial-type PARG catalytic domain-containing protein n=1 Tax=Lasiosphaeris hirsuta TaxID=260670 RepID=A0AA40DXJ5_9PEZI|nr:hypothetical protein B0H67DRAFT_239210 [Lasiosphaeris hirsuta]
MPRNQAYVDRRKALADMAKETIATTPIIAADLPHLDVTSSELLSLSTLPPLDPSACPGFTLSSDSGASPGTAIRVLNQDTFDAALAMPSTLLGPPPANLDTRSIETHYLSRLQSAARAPTALHPAVAARVAVLNMASEKNPGGGWTRGSTAQEEALCYRSTLAASLHRRLYPIAERAGVYTHDVVVFREAMGEGHGLLVPGVEAARLPVASVLSVAGIRRPEVKGAEGPEGDGKGGKGRRPRGRLVYAAPGARDLMKDKMRLCLRMAGARGHTMLVLGALGCGAFRNPPEEVAACWLEVLSGPEFAGGWFREVWFAVYDRKNEGNFETFQQVLDGKSI